MDTPETSQAAKKTVACNPQVKVISAVADTLHGQIDALVASHSQAGLTAPFLEKARAAASDMIGHLGSHLVAEPGAATQPAAPAQS